MYSTAPWQAPWQTSPWATPAGSAWTVPIQNGGFGTDQNLWNTGVPQNTWGNIHALYGNSSSIPSTFGNPSVAGQAGIGNAGVGFGTVNNAGASIGNWAQAQQAAIQSAYIQAQQCWNTATILQNQMNSVLMQNGLSGFAAGTQGISGTTGISGATATTGTGSISISQPCIDVLEDETQIGLNIEMPGVSEKDFNITFSNGCVIVEGTRSYDVQGAALSFTDRTYGLFRRVIPLNVSVETAKMSTFMQNGILTIYLPKAGITAGTVNRATTKSMKAA